MKALRIFITVILSFVLVALIVGVTLISSVKEVVQTQLVGEAVKQSILKEVDNVDIEGLDEIIDSKTINKLIDSVLTDYTNYVEGKGNGVSDETVDIIVDYIYDNKDKIEKVVGQELDFGDTTREEAKKELKESLNDEFAEIDENSEEVNKAIVIYANVTSSNTLYIILGVIAVIVVLIGLVNWNLYSTGISIGVVSIVSGIINLLLYLLTSVISGMINSSSDVEIKINFNLLLIVGASLFVFGIVLLIVSNILNKKKVNNNEVTPVVAN